MEFDPKLPDDKVNVSSTSPLVEFASMTAGLLAIVFLIYWLLGLGIDWAVDRMTPEQEKALSLNIDFEGPAGMAEQDSARALRLQKLVDRLQSQCTRLPYDFKVRFIPDPAVNAAALPGGTILVFQGLIDAMKSENALAFVLGHELGHFKNRDHLKHLGRSVVLMVLWAVLTGNSDSIGSLISPSLNSANAQHSQKQESKADEFGLQAVNCLYGHVSGATQFFETMQKREHRGALGRFFDSHPTSPDRIDHLRALAKSKGFEEGALTPMPPELQAPPSGPE